MYCLGSGIRGRFLMISTGVIIWNGQTGTVSNRRPPFLVGEGAGGASTNSETLTLNSNVSTLRYFDRNSERYFGDYYNPVTWLCCRTRAAKLFGRRVILTILMPFKMHTNRRRGETIGFCIHGGTPCGFRIYTFVRWFPVDLSSRSASDGAGQTRRQSPSSCYSITSLSNWIIIILPARVFFFTTINTVFFIFSFQLF